MRKKFLSLVIVLTMLLSLMPFVPMTAYAAVEGDWLYTLYDGDTTAAITGYNGTATEIVIPTTIAGKPVTRIGSNAFYNNTTIASATIPDSVLRIESGAFQNSVLNMIDFGEGLTYIGQNAFNGSRLSSVTIPSSVTHIDSNSFAMNRNLISVTFIGNNLQTLGAGAFSITGLSTISIPTSLSSIEDWTFNDSYLNSLTIPANITNIGNNAFANNANLPSALFEGNAPTMGNQVFSIPSTGFTVYYYSGSVGFTSPTWIAGSATLNTVELDPPSNTVCQIGSLQYETLSAALAVAVDGDTITLLKNIDYTSQVTITGKHLALELNNFTLNIFNESGTALEVGSGGKLSLTGDGAFNVYGNGSYGYGVYAHNGGEASVTNASASGYSTSSVYAYNGAIINVSGNATGSATLRGTGTYCYGVSSEGIGSIITVMGNVSSNNNFGAFAQSEGTVIVEGDATGYYGGAYVYNGNMQIEGSVTGLEYGAYAVDGTISVGGDAISTANNGSGAHAAGVDSSVSVTGNAISQGNYGKGAFSGNGAIVNIGGNAVSEGTDGNGAYASDNNARIKISGNIMAENGTGAWVRRNTNITVDGTITAADYIKIEDANYNKEEYSEITTKLGYLTYSDGSNTVWVKEPFDDSNWNSGITSENQYPFGGGDGSSVEQSYEISTPLQMAQLAYNVNSGNSYANNYFILTSSIDLSGKQWMPVGKTYGNSFNGSLDGNGHSVSGLTINEVSGADAYGLFGFLGADGVIEDLIVESGNITFTEKAGDGNFGGIVGLSYGLVKNCVNKANISVINNEWTYAGGIVGVGTRIFGCRNEGDIQIGSKGSVGGILGSSAHSIYAIYIDQSSNSGSITGGKYAEVGGIAGRINNANTLGVINCFNTGSVTSGDGTSNSVYAGGIVGYEYYSRVKNCYNTGDVTILYSSLGNTFCGGISGYADIAAVDCYNLGNVNGTGRAGEGINGAGIPSENCYYLDTSTPSTEISGITSLTDAQMKNQASYEGWDFPDIWSINRTDNNGYPALAWQGFIHETTSNDATLSGLSISGITLLPTFDSATTDYIASVSNSIGSTTISAVTSIGSAAVSINGMAGSNNMVALNVGSNTVTVTVTAEDGTTIKTYTITINRAARSSMGSGSTPIETGRTVNISTTDGSAFVKGSLTETEYSTKIVIKNDAFSELDDANQSVSINALLGTVEFDKKAMDAIGASSETGDVILTIRQVPYSELSERDRSLVGLRPVYDLTVARGKTVSDFKSGHATVTIPYTLNTGENPYAVVIYYLSDDGKLTAVRGHYDADLKAVIFKTTHFSKFVMGYHPVSFNDVVTDVWYKNAVDFIAARDITSGTGNNMFGPEAKLTRAQFVVFLMNAYQINTKNQGESSQIQNFSDAGNTYYTDYLLTAKALGIINGVGNNLFAPEDEITKQEMFVMLFNALNVIDEVPASVINTSLSSFYDADKIASWAKEALSSLVKTGVVRGDNNNLYPTATITRAEIAQVLYNLLSK